MSFPCLTFYERQILYAGYLSFFTEFIFNLQIKSVYISYVHISHIQCDVLMYVYLVEQLPQANSHRCCLTYFPCFW